MTDFTVILLALAMIFLVVQYFFFRYKSKIAGIVLPIIWFSASLVPVIFVGLVFFYINLGSFFSDTKIYNSALLTLLVLNIPTIIMLLMLLFRILKEKKSKKTSTVTFIDSV